GRGHPLRLHRRRPRRSASLADAWRAAHRARAVGRARARAARLDRGMPANGAHAANWVDTLAAAAEANQQVILNLEIEAICASPTVGIDYTKSWCAAADAVVQAAAPYKTAIVAIELADEADVWSVATTKTAADSLNASLVTLLGSRRACSSARGDFPAT